MSDRPRCHWARDPFHHAYHDEEWGVPQHDDRMLFEMLTLEGAQAGLSWRTILGKRAGYRECFAGFDPAVVAGFDAAKVEELVQDARIVRHRGKIESTIGNARAFLEVQREFGSFDAWLWAFVDGKPVVTRREAGERIPARTELSDRISKALTKRGFRFVGSTIIYAYLQAVGVVDDHSAECFRASEA
ncbi:DNA-3-methyladenine glycosylase I [Siccirubricoccus phaeus]|uniref:DNA-3-methyladenine glycosylase I n=1 Tax=Siccirubricoccus phaeus TaxID=2595053 RepID=UPI0011F33B8C|nr:DNA-3-methyladenine glycosylase I [Siccirubricoccus phaeus]